MSCSARLPVYALFVGVFFAQHQALIVLSLYILGIVVALAASIILTKTVLKNDASVFIVELPTYACHPSRHCGEAHGKKLKGL